MKKTENNVLGITLFLGVVVVGSILYNVLTPNEETVLTVDDPVEVYSVETTVEKPVEFEPPVFEEFTLEEPVADKFEKAAEPIIPSFDEAFAEARSLLGPGQTFYWNGQEYRTNYLEEEPTDELASDETIDSLAINNETEVSEDEFSDVIVSE